MEKLVRLLDDFNRDLHPYAGEAKHTLWDDHVELAKYLIDNDVRQVAHGRWEKDPDMRRMNGHIYDYRCSVCRSPAHKGCYNNNDILTNYCPYCGAKMDLKECA